MPIIPGVCRECQTEFRRNVSPSTVARGHGHFCSTACSTKFHRRGKVSNNWRGGRNIIKSGYVKVYLPGNPHARPDGYALEHRIVLAGMLGRPLGRREVVHHRDGNPSNNDPANLELLASQSEHMRLHRNR